MENNKQLVIPIILKGRNYLLWSRTARTALCSRGLWGHIDKAQPPKEDSTEKEEAVVLAEETKWFQEDQTVLAILQSSLEISILEAYSYCETSKDLWETLKNVYGNVSNLTRVFEIKRSLNTLSQEDGEFTKHLGKYQALWAELEALRPTTLDPAVLIERKEQDRVFGLLLTLNTMYNDLIKHLLRSDKLPSFDEVCAQIQKEQGSHGLFGGRELPTANKVMFRHEERKPWICDHCKRRGHNKGQCWILHPHLRPSTPRPPFNRFTRDFQAGSKANLGLATPSDQGQAGSSKRYEDGAAMTANATTVANSSNEVMRRSDLETILQSIASLKESGISLYSHKPSKALVVDSGASHHMISNPDLLNNLEPAIGNVEIANGERIPVKGIGNLKLFDKNSKALFMPSFTSNLLSVKKATTDLNCYAIFGPNNVHFQDIESMKLLGKGVAKDDLYVLEDNSLSSLHPISFKSCFSVSLDAMWHARLGHPHFRALRLMMPHVSFENSSCESCILGKHCKSVFPKSTTIYEKCFDLVHSDVWTSPCMSRDNNKYFVTFIDEKSKYTWITLLPSKDRVFDAFLNFQNYVTNHYQAKIKILRTDNGGEYISHRFKGHLSKHGILHQTSCPYNPQQNGVAERKNRHLMEVARSMMFHTHVPKRFWGDAVMTACYLINRIPTRVLEDQSPFEVLNKSLPIVDHLRVFGCVCFVLIPGEQRTKLDAKSTRCMFIGYSSTQKGYKCFDLTTNRTMVSRDVRFIEEQGYHDKQDWDNLKDLAQPSDRAASLRFLLDHLDHHASSSSSSHSSQATSDHSSENTNVAPPNNAPSPPLNTPLDTPLDQQDHSNEDDSPSVHPEPELLDEANGEAVPTHNTTQVLRRSTRIRKPSNWINPNMYYNAQAVAHPIQATCSLALVPSEHRAFLSQIESGDIPLTYEEAKQKKVWRDAVGDEVGAMERNHTWEESDLPKGKRAVSSKWVFTIKYHSNGDIERYKARLVARGFTQTYGQDYGDTFAPVAKLPTVRVVLSLATNLSWELWQMDVKNAFLQGELEDEVYMTPPPGLEDIVAPGKVLRLRKAIYGLKQSPRAWYHKLSFTLRDHGFRRSEADHTLFTLQNDQGIVVVLIYVDDLIISGDNQVGIQNTKSFLKSTFDIKDLGELKYFLGIEVCRSHDGLFLSQRKYTTDLLNETGFLEAKPAQSPLEDGYKVNREGEKEDEPFEDVAQYRRLVGKLIYLTITRPDLCFAVNQVSQHMKVPTIYHWSMVERILRYLKGSLDRGIWMGRNESTEIVGYCDADWAGDRVDRKSTTGYCTFIGGNLVTWKTKKQKVVACSTAESEYRAMRKLTNELTWLKALLKDLNIDQDTPITMHCDNQAAIHIATNSVFHERTKHIEVDCHKVREKIEEGVILPCYTRSEDQLADIFTKAASPKVCSHIHSKLGLVDLSRA